MRSLKAVHIVLAAAVFALGLSPACSKKKTETPKGEAVASAKAEGAAKAAGKAEAGKGEAAPGTAKASAQQHSAAVAAGSGAPGAALVASMDAPAPVYGWGGVRSLDALIKWVGTLGMVPGPQLPMMVNQMLQMQLGLQSVDWLDWSKPVRVFTWHVGADKTEGAIVLPVKDKAAFTKAVPQTAKKADGGWTLSNPGGASFFATLIDDHHLALAASADAWKSAKNFAKGLVAKYRPSRLVEFRLMFDRLRKGSPKLLPGLRQQANQTLSQLESSDPDSAKVMREYTKALFDAAEKLETASFAVEDKAGDLLVHFEAVGTKDSAIATWAQQYRAHKLSGVNRIPANVWGAIAGLTASNKTTPVPEFAVDILKTAFNLTPQEVTTFRKLVSDLAAVQGNQWAMWVPTDAGAALAFEGWQDTRDGAKLREGMSKLLDFLWPKIVKNLSDKGLPPGTDLSSAKKALETIKKLLEPQGVAFEYGTAKQGGATVDYVTVGNLTKLAKQAAGKGGDEGAAFLGKLFGDTFSFAFAFGPKDLGFAVGPKARERAAAIATSKAAGKAPAMLQRALGALGGPAAFVFAADIGKAVEALRGLIEQAGGPAQQLASAAKGLMVWGGLTAPSNRALQFTMSLPLSGIAKLGAAMRPAGPPGGMPPGRGMPPAQGKP